MGAFALSTTSLLLSCFLVRLCVANDRILTGESLPMNETLVSGGGTFAVGFFTLGASPPRRYLGIWYNNLFTSNRTVVWVANRERPFSAGSPVVLRISNDSSNDLEVTDSGGAVLWSTNTAGGDNAGAGGSNMTAVLLDTGNLVLSATENDVDVRWQSFDHPGDTVLPDMTVWFNATTRRGNRFLSWKSSDDPAPGDFTFGIDPATALQLIVWKHNRTFYRFTPWDGAVRFTPISYSLSGSPDGVVAIKFISSPSMPLRLYLDHSGIVQTLVWDSGEWTSLWSELDNKPCGGYGACGPNSLCNYTYSAPWCYCLPGYEEREVPSYWSPPAGCPRRPAEGNDRCDQNDEFGMLNFSAGCVRRPAVGNGRCDQNDEFGTVSVKKLPDRMVYLKHVGTARACEDACQGNCSCTAYALVDGRSVDVTTRCFVWHGDLTDMFQDDSAPRLVESLHFRLPSSSGKKSTKQVFRKEKAVIIIPVIAVVLSMIILILVWRYKKTLRGFWRTRKGKQMLQYTSTGSRLATKNGEEAGEDVPLQSFEFIAAITNNFSDSNKLGEGGFGKVYKGVMSTGEEVAIKRLSRGSSQGQEEFKNEVTLISKLQHRNLVKLVGSCIHEEERILIYEYVPNGSLSNYLFDSINQVQLDWERRFNIIKGIARGMMYLHQDSRFKIVHRDLKASNILLDDDMNPKISDFGLARIFGGNQSRCITHRVVGTYGYMSPEYAMEGHYSVKSDVYSFGVLLLEIVSGQRNNILYHNGVCLNLPTYAWHMWKEENVMGFLDSSIASTCTSPAEVSRCLHVGLLCVQDHVNERPFMSSIVSILENDTPIQHKPKKPMFMLEAAAQDGGGEIPKPTCPPSVNGMSTTIVEGR